MTLPDPEPQPGGTVERTPGVVIAVAALVGAGLTWTGVSALEQFGQPVPRIPVLGAIGLLVVAIGVAIAARRTHQRVQVRRQPIDPQRAITLLVLGKTALIAGVGLAAAYLTAALIFLPRWDAPLARDRFVGGVLSGLAAGAVGVAGWLLERACEVPGEPDDSPEGRPEGP